MTTLLPYKIECKSDRPYFELIAAFNCIEAAEGYAGECALTNLSFSYRIKYGRKILREFAPN